MKTVCVYHSIDLDGWMSAAIVKHWWMININEDRFEINIRRNGLAAVDNLSELDADTIDFIGYNYGQPIPNLSEYDKVIMCDVSFLLEDMIKLASKLIWIDHHHSAIEMMNTSSDFMCNVQQHITQMNYAACELTWYLLFLNEPMPEIVRLLGRYDCFGHKGTEEEQKILEFQYGAKTVITNYEEAYNWLMHDINDMENRLDDYLKSINNILDGGKSIYKYLCTDAKQSYKNGFPIELSVTNIYSKGNETQRDIVKYKFICINKERFNPINFGIDYHKEGYDGAACFHYDGVRKIWAFSLYNDNGEVDCSVIAKSFGGGGHRGASGMVVDTKTMLKIINGGLELVYPLTIAEIEELIDKDLNISVKYNYPG